MAILVVFLLVLVVLGCLAWQLLAVSVKQGHTAYLLNVFTLQRRRLSPGLNFRLPWESLLTVNLPIGPVVTPVFELPFAPLRCGPHRFETVTQGGVSLEFSLVVEYELVDLKFLVTHDRLNLWTVLKDATQKALRDVVSRIPDEELTNQRICQDLALLWFETESGVRIRKIGINT
jgi:regulator of protease activity HflC (stomatin/prohibitin superfamily)